MKGALLACAALLWAPSTAAAIHAPSKAEWDEISRLQREGNNLKDDLNEYRETRKRLGLIDDDKRARDLAFDRDVFYVQAIRLAERAYGLPLTKSGESKVPGETKGKRVLWVVTAGDRDAHDKKNITGKESHYRVSGMDKAATTYPDGVTVIFPEAFGSPGQLALTLIHEQVLTPPANCPEAAGRDCPGPWPLV